MELTLFHRPSARERGSAATGADRGRGEETGPSQAGTDPFYQVRALPAAPRERSGWRGSGSVPSGSPDSTPHEAVSSPGWGPGPGGRTHIEGFLLRAMRTCRPACPPPDSGGPTQPYLAGAGPGDPLARRREWGARFLARRGCLQPGRTEPVEVQGAVGAWGGDGVLQRGARDAGTAFAPGVLALRDVQRSGKGGRH